MNLVLKLLEGELAILKLAPEAIIPGWLRLSAKPLVSITYTPDELSIVCAASAVPAEVAAESGWRALRVEGKLPFSAVGILSTIVRPLAAAGISIFSLSTFDTDYILVHTNFLEQAKRVLREHFQLLE